MLELLNAKISDSDKISLIKLEVAPISIKGQSYPDAVNAHILQNNYADEDLKELIISYSHFDTQAKSVILEKATSQIRNVISILDSVDNQLISAILLSDKVVAQNKQTIFKALASNATDTEIKQWLPCVESEDFLALYDENKRPRFENTEWNKSLLEIFKNRKKIKDYEFSDNWGKYTISRWNKNDLKDEFLD